MSRRPTYLRVVVWSACPMRCSYCHAEGDPYHGGPPGLTEEDLAACLDAARQAGFRKVKLLGGEPLVRQDLVSQVARLRADGFDGDLSVITSGAVESSLVASLFQAGLDRINVSIHGWTEDAFTRRGNPVSLLPRRKQFLEQVLQWGRPTKLNYVYTGPADLPDLAALVEWAWDKPVVLGVLDNLADDGAGPNTVMDAIQQVTGGWQQEYPAPDPHSLPATRLCFSGQLRVEIKTAHLGELAPWRACGTCAHRSRCREGTFAVRLTHRGDIQLCMQRPDLRFPLLEQARRDPGEAGLALSRWLAEVGA